MVHRQYPAMLFVWGEHRAGGVKPVIWLLEASVDKISFLPITIMMDHLLRDPA
jgi:hypothetical protein